MSVQEHEIIRLTYAALAAWQEESIAAGALDKARVVLSVAHERSGKVEGALSRTQEASGLHYCIDCKEIVEIGKLCMCR